ncbi:hypothetical protein Tco_0332861 [Tanacetum coccineum]
MIHYTPAALMPIVTHKDSHNKRHDLETMIKFHAMAHDRLAEASPFVARIDYAFLNKISEHASEPLSVILQLELEKLAHPANVPTLEDARVSSHITKELTMTPASKYLELSTNADS